MTNELDKLASEVRILELEERKLELEKNITQLKAEHLIDEGCVGCAGPCKVVDVSANLQKKLDATRDMYFTGQKYITEQNAEIRRRDAELHDLKIYQPNNFWAVVTEKDSVIRRQGKIIEELKDQNIADLKELYELDKEDIEDLRSQLTDCKKIDCHNTGVLKNIIDGLEAELSARKVDSAVLMKVVDVANRWSDERIASRPAMNQIAYLVKDYYDAPEVSPETSIDESQNIAVVFTYGEIL